MSVQRRKPRICPGGESAGGFTQGLEGLPKALKKVAADGEGGRVFSEEGTECMRSGSMDTCVLLTRGGARGHVVGERAGKMGQFHFSMHIGDLQCQTLCWSLGMQR